MKIEIMTRVLLGSFVPETNNIDSGFGVYYLLTAANLMLISCK